MNTMMHSLAINWNGHALELLDQRLLPEKVIYHTYDDAVQVAEAITEMKVRGAPAIGIVAAYAIVLSARQHQQSDTSKWKQAIQSDLQRLASSRPTAVNLFWALHTMERVLSDSDEERWLEMLELTALKIHQNDIDANQKMGRLGAELVGEAEAVMTHCNAGALATGGYGTALGVIRSIYALKPVKVFAGETRPWLQGARLTAWELAADGIETTLIADSAAAWLMQTGQLDWIITGADRIASNGDVANKIGTYALAVLARQHHVNFMVVAPMSTIDYSIDHGQMIEIEQRHENEILPDSHINNEMIGAWNPVFDVTPAELVTAIVTEQGVVKQPDKEKMKRLLT